MDQIQIKSFVLGMVGTNCYIVMNKNTQEALVIDPADRADYISLQLIRMGAKPVAILLTHGHFDHIMAVNDLRDQYHIPVYAHEAEEDVLKSKQLNMCGMIGASYTTYADRYLKDNDTLDLAGLHIQVFHTPGHTKGGCCYYIPDEGVLFSGDTLFCSSIGRTDFPTGSMSQLIRSVQEKLFVLPEETVVYPGHDSMTDIGSEKKYNPFF